MLQTDERVDFNVGVSVSAAADMVGNVPRKVVAEHGHVLCSRVQEVAGVSSVLIAAAAVGGTDMLIERKNMRKTLRSILVTSFRWELDFERVRLKF